MIYKYHYEHIAIRESIGQPNKRLNELGELGWELTCAYHGMEGGHYFIFKKESER